MRDRTEYMRKYHRKYRKANPEKMAEYNRTQMERRRARRVVRQAVCAFCGKTFTVSQKHLKYCSKECHDVALRRIRAAYKVRDRAKKRAAFDGRRTCAFCGREFVADIKQHNKIYCSYDCQKAVWAAAKRKGLTAERRRSPERDAFGLTAEQRNAVIRAQNGSRDELWAASQTWTAKQREFAKARFAEIHQLGHKSAWGIY